MIDNFVDWLFTFDLLFGLIVLCGSVLVFPFFRSLFQRVRGG